MPSTTKYPTREEIERNLYKPTKEEVNLLRDWLEIKVRTSQSQEDSLLKLIQIICDYEKKQSPRVHFHKFDTSFYSTENKAMYLGEKRSIITTLHELAHYFWGGSELVAFAYSVGMFKTAFPEMFKKLEVGRSLVNR